jgi:hypothetical protein
VVVRPDGLLDAPGKVATQIDQREGLHHSTDSMRNGLAANR